MKSVFIIFFATLLSVKHFSGCNGLTVRRSSNCLNSSPSTCRISRPCPVTTSELDVLGRSLWAADSGRLTSGLSYRLDPQAKAFYDGPDNAARPLFNYVDENVFKRTTYKAFIRLLDNYVRETGKVEIETTKEKQENWNFINVAHQTLPMKLVYKFLNKHNILCSERDFRRKLYELWFNTYSRRRNSRIKESSGFEHVFVGETQRGSVIGFHNWIQYYIEEKNREINYRGYMYGKTNPHLMAMQYSWGGKLKKLGGFFIGTSPEFDLALYTVSILSGIRQPIFNLGGYKVKIKCFRVWKQNEIATCFPISV